MADVAVVLKRVVPLLLPTTPGASLVINGNLCPDTPVGNSTVRDCGSGTVRLLPASTYAQLVLAAMPEVLTLSTEPILRAYPETLAQDLEVVLSLYSMTGVVLRHANAAQVLTGAAYLQAPVYA